MCSRLPTDEALEMEDRIDEIKKYAKLPTRPAPTESTTGLRPTIIEPRQANLCLRAFRHDKFQLRMPSHSEGPGIWFSV